ELGGSGIAGSFLDWNATTGLVNGDRNSTVLGRYLFTVRAGGGPLGPAPARPTVTAVKPALGPTSGGTVVVLTGTNFTNVTDVFFGVTRATTFHVDSPTRITATDPAHAAGTVDVRVVTTTANSPVATADHFTYADPQTLVGGPVTPAADVPALTAGELQPLAQEAIRRWVVATGDPQTAAVLGQTEIHIADLSDNVLGLEEGNTVWIDANAAGQGWFLDPTPRDDVEFPARVGGHELMAVPGSP